MIEQTNKQTDKQRLQLYVYYRCEMIKYYSFYLSIQKAMGANISLRSISAFSKTKAQKVPISFKVLASCIEVELVHLSLLSPQSIKISTSWSCPVLMTQPWYLPYIPNKQKPVENTRLSGVFHSGDLWISRDNSRVDKVNVDDLITGLGPSFCTAKTWVYFTWCTRDFYMRKSISYHTFFWSPLIRERE